MHVTYNMHVAHSVHVACRYWPGNMYICCMHVAKNATCMLFKPAHTMYKTCCHMQVPGNNNNSIKNNRFCSSISQTCVGSCDSLSQPCAKIPVCHQVLPDCHNLETRLLMACFLYTSLLQPCHMLVQPCHFCMGYIVCFLITTRTNQV